MFFIFIKKIIFVEFFLLMEFFEYYNGNVLLKFFVIWNLLFYFIYLYDDVLCFKIVFILIFF